MGIKRTFLAGGILGLFLTATSTYAVAPKYPIEEFAKLPQYSNHKVSPDGKLIAATLVINGKPIIYIKNRA